MKRGLSIIKRLTNTDQESVRRYFAEINSDPETKPLSPDEEHDLFVDYNKTEDKKKKERIKERIVKSNLRFVITVAKQFEKNKAKLEDLINEGNVGLIKAVDKFDPTRGFRFLSIATWYIRRSIQDYCDSVLPDIIQPTNRFKVYVVVRKAMEVLKSRGFEEPTMDQIVEVYAEIKDRTDPIMTTVSLTHLFNEGKDFISMSAQVGNGFGDNGDMTQGDMYQSGPEHRADFELMKEDRNSRLNAVLALLDPKEREVVEWYFGLNGKEEKTQYQISGIMNYTGERIGQLLANGLNKLRDHKSVIFETCGQSDYRAKVTDNTSANASRDSVLNV